MGAEKSAADLLGDDPTFKDYFKKTVGDQKAIAAKTIHPDLLPKIVTRKTNPVENPLAEYGIPAPGSGVKPGKNAALFKTIIYILLALLALLVVAALFKLSGQ